MTARRLGLVATVAGALLVAADVGAAWLPHGSRLAEGLRLGASPTCHQRPERSFQLSGRPFAACARCTGLHVGGLFAGVMLAFGPTIRFARPRVTLAACGLLPLAADVAAGLAWPEWDHPLLRAATGLMAAASILLVTTAAADPVSGFGGRPGAHGAAAGH